MPTTRRDDRKLNQRKTASILLVYVILRPLRCLPNTRSVDTSECRAILRRFVACPTLEALTPPSVARSCAHFVACPTRDASTLPSCRDPAPHRCLPNTGRVDTSELRDPAPASFPAQCQEVHALPHCAKNSPALIASTELLIR